MSYKVQQVKHFFLHRLLSFDYCKNDPPTKRIEKSGCLVSGGSFFQKSKLNSTLVHFIAHF